MKWLVLPHFPLSGLKESVLVVVAHLQPREWCVRVSSWGRTRDVSERTKQPLERFDPAKLAVFVLSDLCGSILFSILILFLNPYFTCAGPFPLSVSPSAVSVIVSNWHQIWGARRIVLARAWGFCGTASYRWCHCWCLWPQCLYSFFNFRSDFPWFPSDFSGLQFVSGLF